MNTHALPSECYALARHSHPPRGWQFLERYPELGLYLRGKPLLARRLKAHYEKVQEFCTIELAPNVLKLERAQLADPDYVPWDLLRRACDYRLFSMMFPSLLGGAGEHILSAFITYELVASHCVAFANLLGVSGLAMGCVLSTFDPRAIERIAKLIAQNERAGIPTFISTCVTEPGAGSDAEDAEEFASATLKMTATKTAGGYRLNGTKVFISNGSLAQLHVVTAFASDGAHRPEDLLLFLVPKGSAGLSIARNEKKMGQRLCPASEVVFNDVFVPDNMLCRAHNNQQFAHQGIANVLGLTRAGVGAFATGIAENAYQVALDYCRRASFLGEPLERQQWARIELAHLARRAQLARASYLNALLAVCAYGLAEPMTRIPEIPFISSLLRWPIINNSLHRMLHSSTANWLFKWYGERQNEQGRNAATAYADVAKVSCTELAMENCQRAISLMGKAGLRHEFGAEKLLRDSKLLQIYEGTNQVNMLDYIKRRVASQLQPIKSTR